MLERATGNLKFEDTDIVIGPGLTRSEFLKAGIPAVTHWINEPWRSWVLPICKGGRDFGVTLFFQGERLYQVYLTDSDSRFGTSWMNYSPEKERARQESHDSWLIQGCGVPPGSYPWGTVWSGPNSTGDRLATIVIPEPGFFPRIRLHKALPPLGGGRVQFWAVPGTVGRFSWRRHESPSHEVL
jgi:hypothetical protein